jgi:hypothetical protein
MCCRQRYNCVTEDLLSVHPAGNPISHSTHAGFGGPPIARPSVSLTTFPFRITSAVPSL